MHGRAAYPLFVRLLNPARRWAAGLPDTMKRDVMRPSGRSRAVPACSTPAASIDPSLELPHRSMTGIGNERDAGGIPARRPRTSLSLCSPDGSISVLEMGACMVLEGVRPHRIDPWMEQRHGPAGQST